MPNILTDEARERRYARLRAKKRGLDRLFDMFMWIILAGALLGLIPAAFTGLLNGLFLGNLKPFFEFLVSLVLDAAIVYAVYAKKPVVTLAVLLLNTLCYSISIRSPGLDIAAVILLVPLAVLQWQWSGLEKEEGFPLFDISYAEREERQKAHEGLIRKRALEAGARVERPENYGDEMADLLDAGSDSIAMPETLSAYQERFGDAVPGAAVQNPYQPGVMDDVSGLLAPPDAPLSGPYTQQSAAPEAMPDVLLPTLDPLDNPGADSENQNRPPSPTDAEILAVLGQLGGTPDPNQTEITD